MGKGQGGRPTTKDLVQKMADWNKLNDLTDRRTLPSTLSPCFAKASQWIAKHFRMTDEIFRAVYMVEI